MIIVGTGGYAYPDWVGPFYPAGTDPSQFLSLYSREFHTTELEFPDGVPIVLWVEQVLSQVPADFVFAVHLPPAVTHQRELDAIEDFDGAVRPLVEAEQLACVLARFPAGFENNPENQLFLQQLRGNMGALPLVVEFPHKDWIVEGMEGWLRQNDIGFCCVDQPRLESLVQPIVWATSSVGCVRFHGRNYEGWSSADSAVRHDYNYDIMDLAEWLPKIEELAARTELTLVYMHNWPKAQAIEAARVMQRMLQLG